MAYMKRQGRNARYTWHIQGLTIEHQVLSILAILSILTVLYLAEKGGKRGGQREKRRLNWVVVWFRKREVGGQRLGSGNYLQ